jgi:hypothetical protein
MEVIAISINPAHDLSTRDIRARQVCLGHLPKFGTALLWSHTDSYSWSAHNRNQIAVTEGRFDGSCSMDWPDYLRDQAKLYRQQAEQADDPFVKSELLELASVCEEVANDIEDHQTAG